MIDLKSNLKASKSNHSAHVDQIKHKDNLSALVKDHDAAFQTTKQGHEKDLQSQLAKHQEASGKSHEATF